MPTARTSSASSSRPLWLHLDTNLPEMDFWRDPLVLRLWLLLLCWAKRVRLGGSVRFSYVVVSRTLTYRDHNREVRPSRARVRRALLRLAKGGHVRVPGGVKRQTEGGAKGHFPVIVEYWGLDGKASPASDQGDAQASAQGVEQGAVNGAVSLGKRDKRERGKNKSITLQSRFDPVAMELAEHLLASIVTHTPRFRRPTALNGWGVEIGRALRLDGRSEADLRRAIDYAHRDDAGSFWRAHILSGRKLREKLDTLLIQARGGGNRQGKGLSAKQLLAGAKRAREMGR